MVELDNLVFAPPRRFLSCLLPPSAASLFAACLINWELVAVGITWHTATLPVSGMRLF